VDRAGSAGWKLSAISQPAGTSGGIGKIRLCRADLMIRSTCTSCGVDSHRRAIGHAARPVDRLLSADTRLLDVGNEQSRSVYLYGSLEFELSKNSNPVGDASVALRMSGWLAGGRERAPARARRRFSVLCVSPSTRVGCSRTDPPAAFLKTRDLALMAVQSEHSGRRPSPGDGREATEKPRTTESHR
jgi:hypothetical protein